MPTFKQMFKKFLGFDDEADENKVLTEKQPKKVHVTKEADNINKSSETTGREVVLYPKNFGDACEVVEQLEQGNTVIVNMDDVDIEECKRITDFVLGAIYVLEGDAEKISKKVFRFRILK